MAKDWKSKSDEELANEANSGMAGQGAVVEMSRRMRDSNNRLGSVVKTAIVAVAINVVTAIILRLV